MFLLELLALGSLAFAAAQSVSISGFPDTNVVIVSNNDLDPSNPNRASALLLTSAFSCEEAYAACAALQEALLPPPNTDGTGLNAQNLSVVLTSERHGVALDKEQEIWIAADGGLSLASCLVSCTDQSTLAEPTSCAIFTPSYEFTSYPGTTTNSTAPDLSTRLPVLCTNSAPLTRSNVTADTSRQIVLTTPGAGTLVGYRDKFSWRFLGIKYAEPPTGDMRFQAPVPVQAEGTVRTALEYGPTCAQVSQWT